MMTWQYVVAERKRRAEKTKAALMKLSPEGRAKGRCLNLWHEVVVERMRKQATMRAALAQMTPEGRARVKGMAAFKSRCPSWESGSAASTSVSEDAFWITHLLHRTRT